MKATADIGSGRSRSSSRGIVGPAGPLTICLVAAATAAAEPLPVIEPARPGARSDASEPRPAGDRPTVWSVIRLGDDRVGHGRYDERRLADGTVRTRTTSELVVKRFGHDLRVATVLTTHETADGRLLAFEQTTTNPPATTTSLAGVVSGGRVDLTSTVNGTTETSTVAVPPKVRSPVWQDRVAETLPLEPSTVRSFPAFVPDLRRAGDVRVTVGGVVEKRSPDGTKRRLTAVDVTQNLLRQFPVRSFVDDEGTTWVTETPFFGRVMRTDRVPAEFALAESTPGGFDIGRDTLIDVRLLADPHRLKRIAYHVTFDGTAVPRRPPESDRQKISEVADDGRSCVVTVTAAPADREPRTLPQRPAADTLASTQWLQADDYRVRRHAELAVAYERVPRKMAEAMTAYVGRELTEKNFSTAMASAAEVAESLAGDCTEHAVLLAAMLRAKRIPSRVAVGFVYLARRGKLGGHMWTEAFVDGRWLPLDATLDGRPVGPGHLKLAHSSLGDDEAALSLFLPVLDWAGGVTVEVVEAK